MKKLQMARLGVQLLLLIALLTPLTGIVATLIMGAMLFTFLAGPVYCGWMCPMGTLNDITDKISKKLGIKRIKLPVSIIKYAKFVRYGIFAILLAGINFFLKYDARQILLNLINGKTVTVIFIVVLVLFVLSGLFIERLFCNFFCYEGAKNGLLSLARVFLIKRNIDTCVNCKKCTKACPMNISVAEVEEVRDAHCIDCFNCISECPKKGALKFGLTNFKNLRKIDYVAIVTGIAFIAFIINMMSKRGH